MSDLRKLVDIYESFSTRKNISILSEAVEHAISKTPMFLSDSDIDFLEQFDEKYFAQALKKRYDLFGHYLANLYQLRKIVYDKSLPKAEEDNAKYWSNKKFANLPPFVRKNQAHMQSQSQAKAIASDMFPAGQKIPENIVEKSPYFKDLDEKEKKRLSRVVRNINRYYLSDDIGNWGGFIDRNKPPQTIGARSFLSKMASEIEGKLGDREGFDLNNPRIFIPKKEGDLDENLYNKLKELVQKSKVETNEREASRLRRELDKYGLDADSTIPQIKKAAEKNAGAAQEDIESRARIITDGFKIPSLQQIRDQLRSHMVSMGKDLAPHADPADAKRLAGSIGRKEHKLSDDKGIDSVTKQLEKAYEDRVRGEQTQARLAAQAAGKPFTGLPPNKIKERAKQLMKADLQNITNDNFKKYLLQSQTGQVIDKPLEKLTAVDLKKLGITKKELNDIMSIEDPFKGLGFESDVTGKLVKNKDASSKISLPYKKTTVQRWAGKGEAGQDIFKPEEVEIPALSKSAFFRDSKLMSNYDNDNAPEDIFNLLGQAGPVVDKNNNIVAVENPAIGRGPKIFDQELFKRILRRVQALKDPATPPALAQRFANSLNHFNLGANSTMPEIVQASKRYFKRKADPSQYKQGSDVSSTFSHHPGRLSARANFLNRYRQTGRFDTRLDDLLNNGVLVDRDPSLFTPFMTFVSTTVSQWLANTDQRSEIPKAIMGKAKDALVNLCSLRILENLDDDEMFTEARVPAEDAPPDAPDDPEDKRFKRVTAGSAFHIRKIIDLELKRYYDQNLMTGPLRRKGDFLEILEEDAEKELTCKQGQKRSAPGTCVQGMDLRTLQDLYSTGIDHMEEGLSDEDEEDVTSVKGSIVAERKKISQVVEGYYDVIKSLYGLFKIFAKLRGRLNNQQARDQALIDITTFFRDTIRLDDQGFLNSVHATYSTVWNALQQLAKTDPSIAKKLEGIEVAEDFKSPTKGIVDANVFARRLADKKAKLMSGDVSPFNLTLTDENIGTVTDAFLQLAQEEPHKAPVVFQKIMEKLEKQGAPAMRKMFLSRAEPVNNDVIQRQRQAGSRENLLNNIIDPMFFDGDSNPAFHPDKLGNRPQREAAAKAMLKNVNKNVKLLSDRALTSLLAYIHEHKNFPLDMSKPSQAASSKAMAENKAIINQAIKILEDESLERGKYLQSIAAIDNPMHLMRGS